MPDQNQLSGQDAGGAGDDTDLASGDRNSARAKTDNISPRASNCPFFAIIGHRITDFINFLQEKSDAILAVSTVTMAAFTYFLVHYSSGQLSAIQGQLDEMKSASAQTDKLIGANVSLAAAAAKQAKAAEMQALALRGNLRFDGFTPPKAIYQNGPSLAAKPELIGWEVNPLWSNAGGTDIRNYVGVWGIVAVDLKRPIPIDQKVRVRCPNAVSQLEDIPKQIISPGGKIVQVANRINYSDAEKSIALNSTRMIYAIGHAEYNDIFPDTPVHHFDWCVLFLFNDIANAEKPQISPFDIVMQSD